MKSIELLHWDFIVFSVKQTAQIGVEPGHMAIAWQTATDMKPTDKISVQKPFLKCGGIFFPLTSLFGRWIVVRVKHNWGCHAIFYNRAVTGNGQLNCGEDSEEDMIGRREDWLERSLCHSTSGVACVVRDA